jgi:tartrate-resistant acid phosphatase type 5
LGNHDYLSNPQAQVDYSKISARWRMTDRYYAQTFFLNGARAKFIFLDTDPIEKFQKGEQYTEKYPDGIDKQLNWLKRELADSTCNIKIVVGHHPLYTGGWRRDRPETQKLKELLEPIFEQYKVQAYIAGHEHHLEHTKPAKVYTHHFISGGGSEARVTQQHPNGGQFAAGTQGFAVFSLSADKLLVQFIDHKETVIYKKEISW